MNVGFIGLGNAGGKLAASLQRNGYDMTVRDLDPSTAQALVDAGARWADTNRELAEQSDLIITCLPSRAAVSEVMEADDGVIAGLGPGKIWLEMSTTDEAEVKRIGALVSATGARPLDGPVSGGCHRAATGNIAVFVGGAREDFEAVLPALTTMGRRILHVGELGAASVLKVVTNYLASVHLVAIGEALMTAKKSGIDLNTTYEAIRISSGNSFVHETESQVILNGSYNINFTMDMVVKDMSLFQQLAAIHDVPLQMSPARSRHIRARPRSVRPTVLVVRHRALPRGRLVGSSCGRPGFQEEIIDTEPEEPGHEVVPSGGVSRPARGEPPAPCLESIRGPSAPVIK